MIFWGRYATNVRRLEDSHQRRKLGQLLKKIHTRRARAYYALGVAGRAAQDDQFVAVLSTKTQQANGGADDDASDEVAETIAAGCSEDQATTSPWNVREDWAACVERYLGPTDLGRLRRVNRSWKTGVESNSDAWRAAEDAVLGAFEGRAQGGVAQLIPLGTARSGLPLQRVPRVIRTLLGCPPPLVIELGTGYTKCGFAGQLAPSCLVGNFTVRDRIPQEVQIVDIGGLVNADGASLVQFLNAAVFEPLHVDPAYHPVLVILSSHLEAATACIQAAQCAVDVRVDEATQRLVDTLQQELGVPAVKVVCVLILHVCSLSQAAYSC